MTDHCLRDLNHINELKAQFCNPSPFASADIITERLLRDLNESSYLCALDLAA